VSAYSQAKPWMRVLLVGIDLLVPVMLILVTRGTQHSPWTEPTFVAIGLLIMSLDARAMYVVLRYERQARDRADAHPSASVG
jgi:hypothetical protein